MGHTRARTTSGPCRPAIARVNALPRRVPTPGRCAGRLMLVMLAACPACAPALPGPVHVYFPKPPDPARVVHLVSFNGRNELAPPAVSWVDLLRGLEPGPWVATPSGIAWHEGGLLICDIASNTVQVWPMDGGRERWFGASGTLVKPVAVAADAADAGAVYVADSAAGQVVGFSRDGDVIHHYRHAAEAAYRPVALAVHGGELFVADHQRHCIDVYSAASGALARSFGEPGSGEAGLYYPSGVAIDESGEVFVADTLNGRVQVFDVQGRHLRAMGAGLLGKPRGIAVAPGGVIAVADAEFGRIVLFDRSGRLLLLCGGPADQPGGTPLPVGLAVTPGIPESLRRLLPPGFKADFLLWVSNTTGSRRMGLYAVGSG